MAQHSYVHMDCFGRFFEIHSLTYYVAFKYSNVIMFFLVCAYLQADKLVACFLAHTPNFMRYVTALYFHTIVVALATFLLFS